MSSSKVPKIRRHCNRWLTGLVGSSILLLGFTAAAATADELSITQEIPAGSHKIWVDIESPTVNLQNTKATLDQDGKSVALELKATSFGAGAIVDVTGKSVTMNVSIDVAANADISLSYEGVDRSILRTDHRRASFKGTGKTEPTTSASPSPTKSLDPTPSTTQSGGTTGSENSPGSTAAVNNAVNGGAAVKKEKSGLLANSGFTLTALAVGAVLLALAGGVLVFNSRRRNGAHR